MDIKDRGTYEVLTEADIQDRLINYFSKWFHVDFEITSDCRKRRIDIMMFHHTDNDKLYPMGIELKKTNVKRGGDIAKWCNQASDYTKLTFKGCNPLKDADKKQHNTLSLLNISSLNLPQSSIFGLWSLSISKSIKPV